MVGCDYVGRKLGVMVMGVEVLVKKDDRRERVESDDGSDE